MSGKTRAILFVAFILGCLALCAVALGQGWLTPETLQQTVARSGSLGMLIYILVLVLLEILWLPRMWGVVAGGLLFGPLLGVLLSLVGDLLAASICYFVAAGGGRDLVQQGLARRPKAQRIVGLFSRRYGLGTVILLRLCPVAHYTLVSYSAGLVGISLRTYLLGTLLGIVPGSILYAVAGDAALEPGSPVFWTSIGLLTAALLATIPVARRLLKDP